ncbi:hypothetical protein DH2020_027162 [Rehmannia glutinosa]|uniref:Nucleotide exchange factor Fes1 domain-containing protein n=1 Tax=Rehmannia glutinosa TaxID=99300 RepID=A0ABR0VUW0_REHGL
MERRSISISRMAVALLVVLAIGVTRADRVNKSASLGSFWSTAKEESDLLRWKPEVDDDLSDSVVQEEEEHHLDGGFSSLEGMLQWAVGHSDPEKLKEASLAIQRLSPEELKQRQMEIRELMEKLKTPSDAKLMKIAIDDLNNLSLPLEDRHRALQELLILAEPIDNANAAFLGLGFSDRILSPPSSSLPLPPTGPSSTSDGQNSRHVSSTRLLHLRRNLTRRCGLLILTYTSSQPPRSPFSGGSDAYPAPRVTPKGHR